MPWGTTVTVTRRPDATLVARSAASDEVLSLRLDALRPRSRPWSAYVEGVVWLLRESGVPVPGLDVTVTSDLPRGAGLSSSASLVCATLGAVLDVAGQEWSLDRLATAAREVENRYVGAPVGVMDPVAVLQSAPGHGLVVDTRDLTVTPVLLPVGDDHPWDLMVADTGQAHSTAAQGYRQRVQECAAAAAALGVGELRDVDDVARLDALEDPVLRARARHVLSENERVRSVARLLDEEALDQVGPVLSESHASLRDDFAVSTPLLDQVVTTALAAGATGARVTGAGFGGSVVMLVPRAAAPDVARAVADRLPAGPGPGRVRTVTPAGGAARVASVR